MSRNRLALILGISLFTVAVAVTVIFAGRPVMVDASTTAAPDEQAVPGAWRFSFAVKYVCGYQAPLVVDPGAVGMGEPVVKPGNYATDINIHNYNYKDVLLYKKLLVLVETTANGQQRVVREPESTEPRAFAEVKLGPDFATMDDCFALWRMLHPTVMPPTPMPLMVGYLVIISPVDLDVDAVYTAAAPGALSEVSRAISIDVERVTGKRTFIPAGAVP